MAETMWGFSSASCYLRTYHNLVPDGLTRDDWEAAVRSLEGEGFRRVRMDAAWGFYLEEMKKQVEANLGALVVYGSPISEQRVARQLAERRGIRGMHKEVDLGAGVQLLELYSSTGSFAHCWLGGRRVVVPLTLKLPAEIARSSGKIDMDVLERATSDSKSPAS